MSVVRDIALAVLCITFVTFVALFGRLPALRNTPIGFLNRLLCLHLPASLRRGDQKITGGRADAYVTQLAQYLFHEKHPLVLIVYLSLVTGSATLFLSSAIYKLSALHYLLIPPILGAPYFFTYKCASSSASEITVNNHARHVRLYPYDSINYHPQTLCKTCKFVKPARSKHCSICKTCVSRQDHHCAWVNNCLGVANYHWFMSLLLSLGILLSYGAALSYNLTKEFLPQASKRGFIALFSRWSVAVARDARVGGVGLLALTTAPLAWGLFAYHVYLIWAGMTTNETNKWRLLREDMADGLVFKRECSPAELNCSQECSWPVHPHQAVIITSDGRPPLLPSQGASHEHNWQRCWKLGQLENVYDLGFGDNLVEALLGHHRLATQ